MKTGQTISHFKIIEKLGGGGMGVDYELTGKAILTANALSRQLITS